MRKPPTIDPRTLFPRDCTACGVPKARDAFFDVKGKPARECRECSNARGRAVRAKKRDEERERSRRWRAENAALNREIQAEWRRRNPGAAQQKLDEYAATTRPRAVHHRQEWTGAQLEIVARNDLSLTEMALMTGRTYVAVKGARRKIEMRDPSIITRLGYDPED